MLNRLEIIRYHVIECYFFMLDTLVKRAVLIPLGMVFLVMMPSMMNREEFPTFRIVIDPGHGGVGKQPMSVHGDRYDTLTGRYLDVFKEGAERRGLKESAIVYSIARKTEKILRSLAPGADHDRFYRLLEKYADGVPVKINVITKLSRGKSITREEADAMEDPNAPFRLFDYPDAQGIIRHGRISRINAFKPHLVVSLHLALSGPRDYEGMNPVITPPYDLLRAGLDYLQGRGEDRSFFWNSPYSDWFIEETSRSAFSWFLNDASLYFTGYPLRRNRKVDLSGFKGYRFNMLDWAYAGSEGWENAARHHIPSSRYAQTPRAVVPEGKFWERERSSYEHFRRGGGEEGFGGDNAYASYEIIRYICLSLRLHGDDSRSQKPGKSYISVWIMPLHVNAVNAFIELGYLNRRRDRFLLTRKQDEIAEGIAVGIFSLLTGLEPRDKNYTHAPRGKGIDFNKYKLPEGKTYFEAVVDD